MEGEGEGGEEEQGAGVRAGRWEHVHEATASQDEAAGSATAAAAAAAVFAWPAVGPAPMRQRLEADTDSRTRHRGARGAPRPRRARGGGSAAQAARLPELPPGARQPGAALRAHGDGRGTPSKTIGGLGARPARPPTARARELCRHAPSPPRAVSPRAPASRPGRTSSASCRRRSCRSARRAGRPWGGRRGGSGVRTRRHVFWQRLRRGAASLCLFLQQSRAVGAPMARLCGAAGGRAGGRAAEPCPAHAARPRSSLNFGCSRRAVAAPIRPHFQTLSTSRTRGLPPRSALTPIFLPSLIDSRRRPPARCPPPPPPPWRWRAGRRS